MPEQAGVDKFLDQHRAAGDADSEGGFTVNFAKAREKMAKYQLADVHYFILKFVQAGVLGADSVAVLARAGTEVRFEGWRAELTLDKLGERLCSGVVSACEDPLAHLCIGLNSLMGLLPEGVTLRQTREGESTTTVLKLGAELQWDEEQSEQPQSSSLTISVPPHAEIEYAQLKTLLQRRCGFAPIPVTIAGKPLEARLPDSSGAHREKFFRENKVLARRRFDPKQAEQHLRLGATEKKTEPGDYIADLRLTVDFDPDASIWFSKAGVLLEEQRLSFGVPGVYGVVSADRLGTDLTGVQFLKDTEFEQLEAWLGMAAGRLLDDAMAASNAVDSDSRPMHPLGRVNCSTGCSGFLIAALGMFASCSGWGDGYLSDGSMMAAVFFWIGFPGIFVFQNVYRKGCEKDKNSDEEAGNFIRRTLSEAVHRRKY